MPCLSLAILSLIYTALCVKGAVCNGNDSLLQGSIRDLDVRACHGDAVAITTTHGEGTLFFDKRSSFKVQTPMQPGLVDTVSIYPIGGGSPQLQYADATIQYQTLGVSRLSGLNAATISMFPGTSVTVDIFELIIRSDVEIAYRNILRCFITNKPHQLLLHSEGALLDATISYLNTGGLTITAPFQDPIGTLFSFDVGIEDGTNATYHTSTITVSLSARDSRELYSESYSPFITNVPNTISFHDDMKARRTTVSQLHDLFEFFQYRERADGSVKGSKMYTSGSVVADPFNRVVAVPYLNACSNAKAIKVAEFNSFAAQDPLPAALPASNLFLVGRFCSQGGITTTTIDSAVTIATDSSAVLFIKGSPSNASVLFVSIPAEIQVEADQGGAMSTGTLTQSRIHRISTSNTPLGTYAIHYILQTDVMSSTIQTMYVRVLSSLPPSSISVTDNAIDIQENTPTRITISFTQSDSSNFVIELGPLFNLGKAYLYNVQRMEIGQEVTGTNTRLYPMQNQFYFVPYLNAVGTDRILYSVIQDSGSVQSAFITLNILPEHPFPRHEDVQLDIVRGECNRVKLHEIENAQIVLLSRPSPGDQFIDVACSTTAPLDTPIEDVFLRVSNSNPFKEDISSFHFRLSFDGVATPETESATASINTRSGPPEPLDRALTLNKKQHHLLILEIQSDFEAWTAQITVLPYNGHLFQVDGIGRPTALFVHSGIVIDGQESSGLHRVVYMPPPKAATGSKDVFKFSGTNMIGDAVTNGTFTITLSGSYEAVPKSTSMRLEQGEEINVVFGDLIENPDGDSTRLVIEQVTEHGTLSTSSISVVKDGQDLPNNVVVSFQPDSSYSGHDSLTYSLHGKQATIHFDVNARTVPVTSIDIRATINLKEDEETLISLDDILCQEDLSCRSKAYTVFLQSTPENGNLSQLRRNGVKGEVVPSIENGELVEVMDGKQSTGYHRLYYSPDKFFHGQDAFDADFIDAFGRVIYSASISLVIEAVNNAPIATSQVVSTLEDVPLPIEFSITDVDTDASEFRFGFVTLPDRGSLAVVCKGQAQDATLLLSSRFLATECETTFSPGLHEFGDPYTQFQYRAFDAETDGGVSDNATVTIKVDKLNDPPVALPVNPQRTQEDAPLRIQLRGEDVDGDRIVARVTTFPIHGQLLRERLLSDRSATDAVLSLSQVETTPSLVVFYVPNPNEFTIEGVPDSFEYTVVDQNGVEDAERVQVLVHIDAVRDNNVLKGLLFDVDVIEDTEKTIDLKEFVQSVDGEVTVDFILENEVEPSKGTLMDNLDQSLTSGAIITEGLVKYTPPNNAAQEAFASFSFRIRDRGNTSTAATVTLSVLPINDAPIALDSTLVTEEEEDLIVKFNVVDPSDTLHPHFRIVVTSAPNRGGRLAWCSDIDVDGNCVFTDLELNTPFNYPPPNFLFYKPADDFITQSDGLECITYQAIDVGGHDHLDPTATLVSNTASVCFSVIDINDPPVIPQPVREVTLRENEIVRVPLLLVDKDTEQDDLFIQVTVMPSRGQLFRDETRIDEITLGDGIVTQDSEGSFLVFYAPNPFESSRGLEVFDSMEYIGNDTELVTDTPGRIDFIVLAVNQPPEAFDVAIDALEGEEVVVVFNYSDLDTNADLTVELTSFVSPERATILQFNGISNGRLLSVTRPEVEAPIDGTALKRVKLIPQPNIFGRIEFNYRVIDEAGESATAKVSINIERLNQPPQVSDLSIPILDNSIVNFTLGKEGCIGCCGSVCDREGGSILLVFWNKPDRGHFLINGEVQQTFPTPFLPVGTSFEYVPDPVDAITTGGSVPYASVLVAAFDGNSFSNNASISFNVECNTIESSFVNIWSRGPVCKQCPPGAICSSNGRFLPVNEAGYWMSEREDFVFLACSPRSACLQGDVINETLANAGQQLEERECAPGYRSRICGECDANHFRFQNYCRECDLSWGPMTWITLVALLLLVSMMVIIFVGYQVNFGIIGITVSFFQTLSIISQFKQEENDSNMNGVNRVIVELFSTSCFFEEQSFVTKWVTMMLIPVAVLGLFLLIGVLHWIYIKYRIRFDMSIDTYQKEDEVRLSVPRMRRRLVKFYVLFLSILYLTILPPAVSPFDCTEKADGTFSLDSQPNLLCYSDEWYDMLPLFVLGFIMYAFGIPLFFVSVLFISRPPSTHTKECPLFPCIKMVKDPWKERRRRVELEEHLKVQKSIQPDSNRVVEYDPVYAGRFEKWIAKYGSLTQPYDPITFYWELIIITRKFLLSMTQIFMTQFPTTQAILSCLIFLIAIYLQLWARPYRSESNNFLELSSLSCSCLLLISAIMVYGNPDFRGHWLGQVMDYVTTVLIYSSFIYIGYLVSQAISRQLRQNFVFFAQCCPIEDWDGDLSESEHEPSPAQIKMTQQLAHSPWDRNEDVNAFGDGSISLESMQSYYTDDEDNT